MLHKTRRFLASASVVALMAAVPAASSAAQFAWVPGEHNTYALDTQVLSGLEINGVPGSVKCSAAEGVGTFEELDYSRIETTVSYSKCSMFGVTTKNVPPVAYVYHADGQFDLVTPLTVSMVTNMCTLTVEPQSNLGTVHYSNSGNAMVIEHAVEDISYSVEGLLCASSEGTDAVLTGLDKMVTPGGGFVNWGGVSPDYLR